MERSSMLLRVATVGIIELIVDEGADGRVLNVSREVGRVHEAVRLRRAAQDVRLEALLTESLPPIPFDFSKT